MNESTRGLMRRLLTICTVLAAAVFPVAGAAQAGNLKTIASFCAEQFCADGQFPTGRLTMDTAGRLYGIAAGIAFELAPNADRSKWKLATLHTFCECGDDSGLEPRDNLIIDVNGNLYGTTFEGGANDVGVVYRLSPNARHTKWTYTTIHDFDWHHDTAVSPSSGLTYQGAESGAPYDGTSPLYGMTYFGGPVAAGMVFSLARNGDAWSETDLYTFCSVANCTDGRQPFGGLIVDAKGNIFGTTQSGGTHDAGVAFELVNNAGSWAETVLHNFCEAAACKDGAVPQRAMVMDASGALFGTAAAGGAHNAGLLFSLVPNGTQSQFGVIHDFCNRPDCKDGDLPDSELMLDGSGTLYGTTVNGGGNDTDDGHAGGGTLFRVSGTSLQVLHRFCAKDACGDGEYPRGGITTDPLGHLFGTTSAGGKNGEGTVFELLP